MDKLNVLSLNARGLNSPQKRASVLDLLYRKNIHIAFIQESHFLEADTFRFNNKHYEVVASSCFVKKSKGVLIAIRRNLSYTNLGTGGSGDGRITFCKILYNGIKIALTCVYAPNDFDKHFYDSLESTLLDLYDYQLLIGGDFNTVCLHQEDRTGGKESYDQKLGSKALQKMTNEFSLIDSWRLMNPSSREFSYYSARHRTFSRIDYIFISKPLFELISETDMIPFPLSDHRAVSCSLQVKSGQTKAPRWRFNTSLLQNDIFKNELREELDFFISVNKPSVSDPRILWEVVKGCIRNKTISFASRLNKEKNNRVHLLETEIALIEQKMLTHITQENIKKRHELLEELSELLRQKAEFQIHRTRQKHYLNDARPSRLLALKIRKSEKLATIPAITTENGTITTDPVGINKVLKKFYQQLYASEVTHNSDTCGQFLNSLNLTKISPEMACSLEKLITLEELTNAINSMNKDRSPGLDGIPPELYSAFWSQLGPLLLNMINFSISQGSFTDGSNVAIISLLLKKDKPPTECASYRPLSLLNTEIKAYAKVLARRLEHVMTHLIHHDQTGFIKSRLASDNMRRLLHVLDSSSRSTDSNVILSLDAEKAFDRLEWKYLWSVLEHMGFNDGFISMIKILYANPTAVVITGNTCSPMFTVSRSSRQGCPLSPFLFCLALEPIAQLIRQSDKIVPVMVHNTSHYISLYADDILIYTSNPAESIPFLLQTFEQFGRISGYKVNWTKSALMSLHGTATDLPSFNIPVVDTFKYLGISICPTVDSLTKNNFNKVLHSITNDLNTWGKLPTSFQSRLSIIKMNVLSRINFLSSMLPVAPPLGYWKKLNAIVSSYLWNGKKPRIKALTLYRLKSAGGVSLPNFEWYSWCFALRALSLWFKPHISTSWRQIEAQLLQPYNMQQFLYSNSPLRAIKNKYGPIIAYLMSIWSKVNHFMKTNKYYSQSPIFHNYSLQIGRKTISFPPWERQGVHTLGTIIGSNGLREFKDLQGAYNLPAASFYFYLQLRAAMRAHGVPWGHTLENHPLHAIMIKEKNNGIVSDLYKCIIKASYKHLPIEQLWKVELKDNSEWNWARIWHNVCLSSRNPNHQMIHYKFIHRAYLYPRRLHLMKLKDDPYCDFCVDNAIGTYLHMVWQCPHVYNFWENVAGNLSKIMEREIPHTQRLLLLNDTSNLKLTINECRQILAGVTAAKKMIACRWKLRQPLGVEQWLSSFKEIAQLELSAARTHDAKSANISCWSSLLHRIQLLYKL